MRYNCIKKLFMKRISPFIFAIFQLQFIFLLLMSLYRYWFYISFTPYPVLPSVLTKDLVEVLWFGLRLDLSILGYINIMALLILGMMQFLGTKNLHVRRLLTGYFWIVYFLISLIIGSDLAFFSYFGEHINILVFGIFDDDTSALIDIAINNYNIPLILTGAIIYLFLLWRLITWIFRRCEMERYQPLPLIWYFLLMFILFAVSFTAIRGSFGTFPISKNLQDISNDPFLNKLSENGVYALSKAYNLYRKSKSNHYDLIKMMGYDKNITEAFQIHTGKSVNPNNLLSSLQSKTPKNEELEKRPPHVVVVMVESFGLPIIEYQSETFDILGRLKKHFDEDILFTNFISGGNGTIASLEPVLLNIAPRPESTPFAQSSYLKTSFTQASARVYQSKGYETSFVYGGDLSWRNVGEFMKHQGFDHVEGKAAVMDGLKVDKARAMHTWGIFDQYSYDYVLKKLADAKKPQLIFLLTTNNHPPYDVPSDYLSKPLKWSDEMTRHMSGDRPLMERRLRDYGYALDMAGRFMDSIKADSILASNTVVAITADNNTIEYGMKYDDPITTAKKIPFYLYLPHRFKLPLINTSVAGSHKDLFPTLYHLTLSDTAYTSMGVSLLEKEKRHCGFNDAGIINTDAGTFKVGKAKNKTQQSCEQYYKATLAAEEYLIRSHEKQPKISRKE